MHPDSTDPKFVVPLLAHGDDVNLASFDIVLIEHSKAIVRTASYFPSRLVDGRAERLAITSLDVGCELQLLKDCVANRSMPLSFQISQVVLQRFREYDVKWHRTNHGDPRS